MLATIGKIQVITEAQNQWTKVPKDWPEARTLLGNISEINTHITAPCEKAKLAINVSIGITNKPDPDLLWWRKIAQIIKLVIIPKVPQNINFFLPILSINVIAIIVKSIFTNPTVVACKKADCSTIPDISKIRGA